MMEFMMMRWAGHAAHVGAYNNLVGKPEEKRSLVLVSYGVFLFRRLFHDAFVSGLYSFASKYRWKDNIKIDLK
jgi:hypothetical protein